MGFAGALEELGNINENLKKLSKLNVYAKEKLLNTGIVTLNSGEGLPYILNISVVGYRSETLLHFLESKNIFVSSGSACAKGEGSFVLKEMGLKADRIDSALRISFSRFSKESDIDALCEALMEAANKLKKVK